MVVFSKPGDLAGDNLMLLCSCGGIILPTARNCDDHQLHYVGGDTRLVNVTRSISFEDLMKKLEDLFGVREMMLKCKLPTLDVNVLVSVTCDEDLQNVVEEYDRDNSCRFGRRLRGFLFPRKYSPAAESQARKQIYFNRQTQNSAKKLKYDRASLRKYAIKRNVCIPFASQSLRRD